MAETQGKLEIVRWSAVKKPLIRAVLAGFGDRVGDNPGDRPQHKFLSDVQTAFPNLTDDRLTDDFGRGGYVTPWAARNMMIQELGDVKLQPRRRVIVSGMAGTLAEMAGGDETAKAVAYRAFEVLGTRERFEAVPLLGVLSTQAIEHLSQPEPQQ